MSDNSNLTHDAKSHVQDISKAAKDRVAAEAEASVDAARHAAADEAQTAANAAEAAADQFSSNSFQAQAAHRIADQIEGVANQLRSTDINTLVSQTSEFARRNPMLFIGGAAALGFAATRFLKARDPHPTRYADDDADPWQTTSGAETAGHPHPRAVVSDFAGGTRNG